MNTTLSQPRISTLAIEVSVIKIGNGKMTLSVFDQLYDGSPYDDNYKIVYPVWGKVNRSGDDYVVFQLNNELRKSRIGIKEYAVNFRDCIYSSTIGRNDIKAKGWLLDSAYKFYTQMISGGYVTIDDFLARISQGEMDMMVDEYNIELEKTRSYNNMIDTLRKANQLFIGV